MQKEQEEQKESVVDSLVCPSFSTYSSDKLADIADQVTRDHFQNDSDFEANDDHHHRHQNEDNDFEFVAFRKAADGVFFEGYAGPVFPIFNRDLVTLTPTPTSTECDGEGEVDGRGRCSGAEEDAVALQFPMGKLLISDEDRRHDPPSSSSSEVDDLDAIPAGTYCVWTPKSVQASPSRCKKSNSTGTSSSTPSKRWKLLDLLRRSNSDGKDTFVFLTPSNSAKKKKKEESKAENSKERRRSGSNEDRVAGKKVAASEKKVVAGGEKKLPVPVSAHEALYVRNREIRRVDKRRSYLPYRQDLVGFCASLNGMGRTFPPF